ncbi:hypothetical protein R5H30_02750 [Sulfitobacter sp. D35]|uniref:hypothetical protein n=1 Tax=Sulfitobacter sp. D35 TaxID=3083252 RepID=UPI00296F89CE|nr:hypothetical protein [Sulfitobacter sp. D35]MDW4496886.1 hypothetical protein [Sulfitobacter sp. D35]
MIRCACISLLALAGCASAAPTAEDLVPDYLGVRATPLDRELVQVVASMTKALEPGDVTRYADCAAARYTLAQGYGFARHLRTNVSEEAGVWTADAVYTISPSLPRGLGAIDAEVVAADCAENRIPSV